MSSHTFCGDSFSPLAGDLSSLPIFMHHTSASQDCLPASSHAHSMVSAVSSGLSLSQSAKRPHMQLASSSLANSLGSAPPSLHYPVTPCHYSNQQTAYGIMAAQEMLSASISQTCILQTCGVPPPNMVSAANPLQVWRPLEEATTSTCAAAHESSAAPTQSSAECVEEAPSRGGVSSISVGLQGPASPPRGSGRSSPQINTFFVFFPGVGGADVCAREKGNSIDISTTITIIIIS
ncbi:pituitary-specific positive transcription factor 1-like [Entelurus aequoreus]|uniref:pituitary-specific positive transcription factor 1-like n=1 Tax=Entelurus aequoreus TaxID=161455 RepID=UPI002B1DFF07|nr:pituitary-specific positive transcription factor 1-like [Entelurus aequoreus]